MSKDDNGEGVVESFDESEDFDDDDVVVIVDEAGVERSCGVLAVAEIDGLEYALLAPVDQLEDDEGDELELFIFRYEHDEDETEVFRSIDDEAIYEKVKEFFSTLIDQDDEE